MSSSLSDRCSSSPTQFAAGRRSQVAFWYRAFRQTVTRPITRFSPTVRGRRLSRWPAPPTISSSSAAPSPRRLRSRMRTLSRGRCNLPFPPSGSGIWGVGGYGTFQSLLLLRELYARGARPRTVIYGFLPFHAERNIAHAGWLRVLAQYSRLGHETLPFASLDDNGVLLEHGPAPFRAFPFREQLALADLAAKVHFKFLDPEERRRRRDAQQVTCKLISDMNRLARRNGSAFYVALLGQLRELGPFPPAYESCCRESGVETIDCRIDLGEEYIVRGESHPNEEAHAIWAECLTSHLRNRHGT